MKKVKKNLALMVVIILAMFLSACTAGSKIGTILAGKDSDKKLYVGIKNGNIEQVKEGIQEGANINKIESIFLSESNPFIIALTENEDKIAEYLIDQGANVNYSDNLGRSLLMFSAYNTDEEFCNLLIKHGAKVDKADKSGDTALEYALHDSSKMNTEQDIDNLITILINQGEKIKSNTLKAALKADDDYGDGHCRYGVMKRILKGLISDGYKSGLDPTLEASMIGNSSKVDELIKSNKMKDETKQQILFYTAAFGNVDTLKLLQENGVDFNSRDRNKNTPLIIASQYGNLQMVKYLLSLGADIRAQSKDGDTALLKAIRSKNYEVTEYLIKSGAVLKDNVLNVASSNGNLDIIKLIISNGYSLNNESLNLAFASALEYKHFEVAKYLLDKGADPNKENNTITPLEESCLEGNLEAVKFLIDNGASIDGRRVLGRPLNNAAENGNTEVVEYLIKKGANVNIVSNNNNENTALRSAISGGYFDIVKLLVENGADLEYKYPILNAAAAGSKNILEYLIQKGANVNVQNENGYTALMNAASHGYIDNIKVLLKYKADASLKNKEGHTALDMAKEKKNKDIIKILENAK